ncbi:isoflavone reductase family protein [Pterulicium gracile]|uniref:Isoflavone reductase family protein n=1 Tax=Pterulicium gracile TaxID=1884261 RepID=A0A5C3QP35_9AGAR|nr:isoflavone reductase family protein [Pterula gracilis]
MSSTPTVLLLGATGETGQSILKGLVESNAFNVEALVRPASSTKPEVEELRSAGIAIRLADTAGAHADLVKALKGVDIFVSAIGPNNQLEQLRLVDAVKEAGVKRFIPCGFITISPVGGVMRLRDEKEKVYNYMKKQHVPFTVIDTGFWYQISLPRVPSGKYDAALARGADEPNEVYAGGDAPNILTDLRDIGVLVAQIIQDERTLNQYVYTCGEVLSQKEIIAIVESVTGETVEQTIVTTEQVQERLEGVRAALAADPSKPMNQVLAYMTEYCHSKYVRADNSPAYAKYLGYLDTRDLYPGTKTRTFRDFLADVLDGKVQRVYSKKS